MSDTALSSSEVCHIMAEGFRFMPFGFSYAENLSARHMGYLGATLMQVLTRACGADVSLRDVTISRDGKQGYKVRVTSRTGSARRIWGISKKLWRVETRRRRRRFDFWGSQRRDEFARYGRRTDGGVGADEEANIKRLCLSPYVEEPLNSKVIKGS